MKAIALPILLIAVICTSLTSCSREISSDVYVTATVGEVNATYPGVVRKARVVRVEDGDCNDEYAAGAVAGGVAGGIIGACAVDDEPNAVATTAGAVGGMIAGSMIEKRLRSQRGIEYTVELERGDLITIVQGVRNPIAEGTAVYLVMGHYGRSRVIPQ